MSRRRIALLVNPAASGGKTDATLARARAELDRLGAEFRVVEPSGPPDARAQAARAADAGEVVAALGGDGFAGTIAGALARKGASLALVPAGRGNDFARVLGIPGDTGSAIQLALRGAERLVDIGEVDGRSFLGIASVGFDSEANRIANEAKLVRGSSVYLYAALRALAGWRHAAFEVVVDGEHHTVTGYSVAVANSKAYGGGMYLVPHAQLDDGRLDVMLSAAHSKLHFLRHIPKVFKGTHVDDPSLRFLQGQIVEVSADRPFTVYADGDPIGRLPVTVRVIPRALRVIAP